MQFERQYSYKQAHSHWKKILSELNFDCKYQSWFSNKLGLNVVACRIYDLLSGDFKSIGMGKGTSLEPILGSEFEALEHYFYENQEHEKKELTLNTILRQNQSLLDAQTSKKKVSVLYLEGDGVMIKGTKGRLEFHRYQVCEGIRNVTYKRRERVNAKEFVSLSRLDALNEAKEYLANTYDLTDTLIISNADGGAGYTKKDFGEIVGHCSKHEHFLDVFHLNKKIKDRLCFAPELQGELIYALEFKYDRDLVNTILNTAESKLIEELDTPQNHEHLARLRSYINRRWDDIKPFKMRNLKAAKAIGSCESNHRKYTYRVKGQGKYWSKAGAESMIRILTCIKNHDLEQWLNSDFEAGKLISLDHKKLLAAARDSLKRRHEIHVGIQHGALTTEVAGGSYLSKFNRKLNHIKY